MWGLVIGVLVLIGATGGFYTATLLQKQIEVLIGAPVVLAILTWIGSATDLFGFLRTIIREKHEEETIPKLSFCGFTKTSNQVIHGGSDSGGGTYWRNHYFLIVRKESGQGFCKAM